jgi:hypothetical protein
VPHNPPDGVALADLREMDTLRDAHDLDRDPSRADRRTIMTLRAIGPMLGALGICATIGALGICATIGVGTLYVTKSTAQSANPTRPQAEPNASPIYGVTIPDGYRDWRLISVKQLTGAAGKLKQLRAQLGNDIATKAFRDGTLPFPDGAIIAALHWNEVSSDADNKVLAVGFPDAGLESFFAGSAVNVQFMVKDSKKYAASGGWGFADFTKGKPGDEALHAKCFPCHAPAKDRDYVFTRYARTPGTE